MCAEKTTTSLVSGEELALAFFNFLNYYTVLMPN